MYTVQFAVIITTQDSKIFYICVVFVDSYDVWLETLIKSYNNQAPVLNFTTLGMFLL